MLTPRRPSPPGEGLALHDNPPPLRVNGSGLHLGWPVVECMSLRLRGTDYQRPDACGSLPRHLQECSIRAHSMPVQEPVLHTGRGREAHWLVTRATKSS